MTWIALVALVPVAFVVAELAARELLARRGKYYPWPPFMRVRLEVDRDVLPQLEPIVRFEVNRDGERGADPPPRANEPGVYRVLVCGGSAAECYFLDQPSAWSGVIESELSSPESLARLGATRVHVGNVARSLIPCETIDWMLAKILPRYGELDAIVFMVGASDLVHWLERDMPPELEEGRLSAYAAFGQHPEGPFGWSPKTLALRRLAAPWKRRILKRVDERERAGKRLAAAREMRANAKEIIDRAPDPAPMLAYFEKYYRRALERAAGAAKRVVVARQPWFDREFSAEESARLWNFGVGRPYQQVVERYYSHRLVRELMEKVDAVASRVASEVGVEQVDLRPELELSFDTYYDFLHFTPQGARKVGEVIARKILER